MSAVKLYNKCYLYFMGSIFRDIKLLKIEKYHFMIHNCAWDIQLYIHILKLSIVVYLSRHSNGYPLYTNDTAGYDFEAFIASSSYGEAFLLDGQCKYLYGTTSVTCSVSCGTY